MTWARWPDLGRASEQGDFEVVGVLVGGRGIGVILTLSLFCLVFGFTRDDDDTKTMRAARFQKTPFGFSCLFVFGQMNEGGPSARSSDKKKNSIKTTHQKQGRSGERLEGSLGDCRSACVATTEERAWIWMDRVLPSEMSLSGGERRGDEGIVLRNTVFRRRLKNSRSLAW